MELPKDFLTSAACTYNVQVLEEVCAYSFKGGRNLLIEIETDQHLENDCPEDSRGENLKIALFEPFTTVDGIVLNNHDHWSKNLFSSYGG